LFLFFFAEMDAEAKEFWMRRAMQLARFGEAAAAPNPLVGCVIVHPAEGLIGEGWHSFFGGPHAEVNAFASVKRPELIPESTLLVNLEPCVHYGKTPPCCMLIKEKGVAEVIVSNPDPNPLVSGKGMDYLRQAGIRVESGLLAAQGRELNRFFFTALEKKRPFISLKWAQSEDGFIGPEDGFPIWISSYESRLWVHSLRASHQGIMAGRHTLRNDDPLLNLRNWPGRQPKRIVADPELELPENLRVFQDAGSETWIFNRKKQEVRGHLRYQQMESPDDIPELLQALFRLGIHSLLVEGGSRLLQKFFQADLWDEAVVFTGNQKLNSGIAAPEVSPLFCVSDGRCGPDRLQVFRPVSPELSC